MLVEANENCQVVAEAAISGMGCLTVVHALFTMPTPFRTFIVISPPFGTMAAQFLRVKLLQSDRLTPHGAKRALGEMPRHFVGAPRFRLRT